MAIIMGLQMFNKLKLKQNQGISSTCNHAVTFICKYSADLLAVKRPKPSPADIGAYNCFQWEFSGFTAKPPESRAQYRIKYFTMQYSGILLLIRYLPKDFLKSVTILQYISLKVKY